MKITTLTATIRGIRPLLMHNGALADPMNPHSRALASAVKRAKTSKSDDDRLETMRAEFVGGLYFDKKLGPVIPAGNLQAMTVEGARKRKMGKDFEALVQIVEPIGAVGYKVEYTGTRDPDAMFASEEHRFVKGVKVGQSTVQRTRPRFPEWSITFDIEITEGGPSEEQVREALEDAGAVVGLGDWTPRYGRFELVSLE